MIDHNKIILNTAKTVFKGKQIFQSGKSRLFYKDKVWYIINISFQSSGFSKGTYLSVSTCWLWDKGTHFSSDVGSRELGFLSADEPDFESKVAQYASHALSRAEQLERQFKNPKDVATYFRQNSTGNIHYLLDFMISLIFDNDIKYATSVLNQIEAFPVSAPWVQEVINYARDLRPFFTDRSKFTQQIAQSVIASRRALKLHDSYTEEQIAQALDT